MQRKFTIKELEELAEQACNRGFYFLYVRAKHKFTHFQHAEYVKYARISDVLPIDRWKFVQLVKDLILKKYPQPKKLRKKKDQTSFDASSVGRMRDLSLKCLRQDEEDEYVKVVKILNLLYDVSLSPFLKPLRKLTVDMHRNAFYRLKRILVDAVDLQKELKNEANIIQMHVVLLCDEINKRKISLFPELYHLLDAVMPKKTVSVMPLVTRFLGSVPAPEDTKTEGKEEVKEKKREEKKEEINEAKKEAKRQEEVLVPIRLNSVALKAAAGGIQVAKMNALSFWHMRFPIIPVRFAATPVVSRPFPFRR